MVKMFLVLPPFCIRLGTSEGPSRERAWSLVRVDSLPRVDLNCYAGRRGWVKLGETTPLFFGKY